MRHSKELCASMNSPRLIKSLRAFGSVVVSASMALTLTTGCASSGVATSPEVDASEDVLAAPAPRLKVQWRAQATNAEGWAYLPQEYAKPVFLPRHDDLVVASSYGYLTRFRAGSGEVVWREYLTERGAADGKPLMIHADPVVVDDVIYLASMSGVVEARSLDHGELLWRYQADNSVESSIVVEGGRLFMMDAGETLSALDSATGKLLWRYKRRSPEYFTIKGAGVPVVDGDAVYCGFSDGTLAAIQIDTGEAIWTSDLSNDETEFTDVDTQAIVSGELIYISSYAGGVFAVSRLDGTIQWQAPVPSVTRMIKRGQDLIVASATGRVVSLNVKERQMNWSFKFQQHTPVELAYFGPYVFVSTTAGPLSVLDLETGNLLTRWNPSQGFNVPVVFEQRRGFIVSNSGYLYSFEVAF